MPHEIKRRVLGNDNANTALAPAPITTIAGPIMPREIEGRVLGNDNGNAALAPAAIAAIAGPAMPCEIKGRVVRYRNGNASCTAPTVAAVALPALSPRHAVGILGNILCQQGSGHSAQQQNGQSEIFHGVLPVSPRSHRGSLTDLLISCGAISVHMLRCRTFIGPASLTTQ